METIAVKTQQELDRCLAIRNEVFVVEQQVPPEEEVDEFDVSPEACHHALLLDEDNPIGTGRWRFYSDDKTVKMQRIALLKESRGKGLGKELLLAMEKQATQEGAEFAILDAQCHAETFYCKLGYITLSTEPFYDAGILHVRMRKQLVSQE